MRDPWIQTCSGKLIDLLNPDPTSIDITDVAFSLARLCRFTGHADSYSVAQHCVIGARVLREQGASVEVQREFLLHDARESIIGDVASPIKRAMVRLRMQHDSGGTPFDAYLELERRVARAFSERFNTPAQHTPPVHEADMRMLATEARDLMEAPPHSWELPDWAIAYPHPMIRTVTGFGMLVPWSDRKATSEYLRACAELGVQ